MSDYGLSSAGFITKRLQNIRESVVAGLQTAFGQINTAADSVFGQFIGVFSKECADVWEQVGNVYSAMYPSTAEGQHLDNAADFTGAVRLPATASTAIVQMKGDEGTVVPLASVFSQSLMKETFETLAETEITAAALHRAKVRVDSAAAETYSLTIDGSTIDYIAVGTPTKAGIASGITDAVNAVTELLDIIEATYTTGDDFLTITAKVLDTDESFSITSLSADLSLSEIETPVSVQAQTQGKITIPLGSIDTINTPVSGLSAVTNLIEGTTGRDVESDDAFRVRRRESLSVIAAGTLASIRAHLLQDLSSIITAAFMFENNTDDTDDEGRPPHSFETVVAALSNAENNQAIADKIWSLKPAGILPYGTTEVTVVDGNGNNQVVGFTHAKTQYAWVELTYDRTGADTVFPSDGEDQIKAAILALGQSLNFGSDLLKQRFENCGYVAGGVTSVTVRLAVTASEGDTPAWQTTNVVIATSDYPSFDAVRITVKKA